MDLIMKNNNNISIQFLGAAGTVTGSKHLLKTNNSKVLIDCGLYQGLKKLREKNREEFPVDVKSIDAVVITHAHLDHCGYLPVLVKNGYKGRIIMTPPTKELVTLILLDSAKIQEEEAKLANSEGYSKHSPALPLYTESDVNKVLELIEVHLDRERIRISDELTFEFAKNGHILGSASLIFHINGKRVLFSGDLGRANDDLLNAPEVLDGGEYLVLESTYGDRLHPKEDVLTLLEKIILDTWERGGSTIIPSFAVGRAQEMLYLINELKEQKRIPAIPVYLDSPMGTSATEIFQKYSGWHKISNKKIYNLDRHVTFVKDVHETQRIIKDEKRKIVIAASGMITGGRVLNYISQLGWDPLNTILLVGYQGEGTRGRSLKEGAKELKIRGKYVQIGAEIQTIDSLSAHADQEGMLDWVKAMNRLPEKIFLVHGEPTAQNVFRVKIQDELGIEVIVPELNDEINLP
jgi:metallo-beta-lactamase family protein